MVRSPKVWRASSNGKRLDRLLAHRDDVVRLDPVGRDVDALAVDLEVAVRDQLAGVRRVRARPAR
jgi:hypothetical protein